jgi:hypothetical protein
LPGFSSLHDAIHGWMTGRMDGKLHKKGPRRPLIYVIYNIGTGTLVTLMEQGVPKIPALGSLALGSVILRTPAALLGSYLARKVPLP